VTSADVTSILWRSTLVVTVSLVAITIVIVLVRHRWPTLAVRVVTSVTLVALFIGSAQAVMELVQAWARQKFAAQGIVFWCVLPGYVNLWGPAAISALTGFVVSYRLRASQRIQGAA
jgi:hypothetical protein